MPIRVDQDETKVKGEVWTKWRNLQGGNNTHTLSNGEVSKLSSVSICRQPGRKNIVKLHFTCNMANISEVIANDCLSELTKRVSSKMSKAFPIGTSLKEKADSRVNPKGPIHDLSIVTWNTNGKKVEGLTELVSLTKQPDIICLQETGKYMWGIGGYDWIWAPPAVTGKGLLTGVRKGLKVTTKTTKDENTIELTIDGTIPNRRSNSLQEKSVTIVNTYVNPHNQVKVAHNKALHDKAKVYTHRKRQRLVIVGDFNNSREKLIRVLDNNRLTVADNKAPTWQSGGKSTSILDHFVHSKSIQVEQCTTLQLNTSDHKPIWSTIKVRVGNEVFTKRTIKDMRLNEKVELELAKSKLWKRLNLRRLIDVRVIVSKVWESELLKKRRKSVFGISKTRRKQLELVISLRTALRICKGRMQTNRKLRELRKNKRAWKWINSKDCYQRVLTYRNKKTRMRRIKKFLARDIKEEAKKLKGIRNEEAKNRIRLEQDKVFKEILSGDAKALWRRFKTRDSKKTESLFDENRNEVFEENAILETMRRHFERLCSDNGSNSLNKRYWKNKFKHIKKVRLGRADKQDILVNITKEEIFKAICTIVAGKAPGGDLVTNDILKSCLWARRKSDQKVRRLNTGDLESFKRRGWDQSPMLYYLSKQIMETWYGGSWPDSWNDATVVALPKVGDLRDTGNYRGISLINTTMKLIAIIVKNKVESFLAKGGVLRDYQLGFRAKRSCVMQTINLLEIGERRNKKHKDSRPEGERVPKGKPIPWNKQETWAGFIDWRKAYDLVPHEALMCKLKRIGIKGNLMTMIRRLYTDQRQNIRLGLGLSNSFNFERGCRQGCPLSPTLFNIFINDVFDKCKGVVIPGRRLNRKEVKGLLFADDGTVMGRTKREVRKNLRKVEKWGIKNGMSLNGGKCGIMMIAGPMGNHRNRDLKISDTLTVPMVCSYKFLGSQVFSRCDDVTNNNVPDNVKTSYKDVLTKMAQARGGAAKKLLWSLKNILTDVKTALHCKLMLIRGKIVPVGLYGAEAWGGSTERSVSLENTVLQGIRWAFKLKKKEGDSTTLYNMANINDIKLMARVRYLNQGTWSNTKYDELLGQNSLHRELCEDRPTNKAYISRMLNEVKHFPKKEAITKAGRLGMTISTIRRLKAAEPVIPSHTDFNALHVIGKLRTARLTNSDALIRTIRSNWKFHTNKRLRFLSMITSMNLNVQVLRGTNWVSKKSCSLCGIAYEHNSPSIHSILKCGNTKLARERTKIQPLIDEAKASYRKWVTDKWSKMCNRYNFPEDIYTCAWLCNFEGTMRGKRPKHLKSCKNYDKELNADMMKYLDAVYSIWYSNQK